MLPILHRLWLPRTGLPVESALSPGQSRLKYKGPFLIDLLKNSEVLRQAARLLTPVIPAQAGIQARPWPQDRTPLKSLRLWVPAFAGTTHRNNLLGLPSP